MPDSDSHLETEERAKVPEESPERIAEERIEAARKATATVLDLKSLGLTSLPISIRQCRWPWESAGIWPRKHVM